MKNYIGREDRAPKEIKVILFVSMEAAELKNQWKIAENIINVWDLSSSLDTVVMTVASF